VKITVQTQAEIIEVSRKLMRLAGLVKKSKWIQDPELTSLELWLYGIRDNLTIEEQEVSVEAERVRP